MDISSTLAIAGPQITSGIAQTAREPLPPEMRRSMPGTDLTMAEPPRPADAGQIGKVNKAKVEAIDPLLVSAISEPERILKPFGVTMLPDGPVNPAEAAGAASSKEDVAAA